MRKFLIYSNTASTDYKIRDLKKSGRWDILLHSIISSLFISNEFRKNVELHLFLMGKPNPEKHIKIFFENGNTISKKNLKKLIEMALKKSQKIKKNKVKFVEVHKGVIIENLTIENYIENNIKENFFLLDYGYKKIKEFSKNDLLNANFIIGDFNGIGRKTKKNLKKNCVKMSLSDKIYFTSQTITIINYEIDCLL